MQQKESMKKKPEKLTTFTVRLETRQGFLLFPHLFNITLEVLDSTSLRH